MGGEDTPYPHWAELLEACEEFAVLSGWRFILVDFMRMDAADGTAGAPIEAAARARAMPTALHYADRVTALAKASPAERANSPLYNEFLHCQRLVAQEAVANSMAATCRALGLLEIPPAASPLHETVTARPSGASVAPAPPRSALRAVEASCEFQDTSAPLPVIATRLANHLAALDRHPAASAQRRERLLHASFVTDFGLEHGLPESRDATSEAMLTEFLQRAKEWGGADPSSEAIVRALVLQQLSSADADDATGGSTARRASRALARGAALRTAALQWFDENKGTALIGGAIFAGALGVLVAGAAIVAAGAAKRK